MSVKGLESLKKYIQKNLLFDIIHTHFLSYNSDRELFFSTRQCSDLCNEIEK